MFPGRRCVLVRSFGGADVGENKNCLQRIPSLLLPIFKVELSTEKLRTSQLTLVATVVVCFVWLFDSFYATIFFLLIVVLLATWIVIALLNGCC